MRRRTGTTPLKERFLSKVQKTDQCWLWTGSKNENGYGTIHITPGNNTDKAHRVAYRLFKGEITERLSVMHSCDNRICVNPDHLSLGTQSRNLMDAHAKRKGQWPL